MITREQLKQEILHSIRPIECSEEWYTVPSPVTGEAVQAALEEHLCVEIPKLDAPLCLTAPIVLRSDHHLKVAPDQLITQAEGAAICLVQNEHVHNGAHHPPVGEYDRNISVRGGIWKTTLRGNVNDAENHGGYGNIILCGVEQVQVSDLTVTDSPNYGVQICDCREFIVERLRFVDHRKDGVHVNGPASCGVVRHLSGDRMGDDMVALNAWDWYTSALTFGTIDHLLIEDVQSNNNELRLLPGQKVYENQTLDCDLHDCVLEQISGIYTFKLYAQPNIANAVDHSIHDVSGTVGRIERIFFHDISFVEVTPSGLNGLPVKSLFEICADCRELYLDGIEVKNSVKQCDELDLRLINVGPLSMTWKNGSEDPEDWGEVFDPDAVCTADELYLSNIRFAGERVTDPSLLTREVAMKINEDYPNTTPKGGTGHGTIGKVCVE